MVWRFKYEKYKALRGGRSGNCASCRLKVGRGYLGYMDLVAVINLVF
jgi:hypothetical protein